MTTFVAQLAALAVAALLVVLAGGLSEAMKERLELELELELEL